MIKELIELQRGSKATCVVIEDSEFKNVGQTLYMDAFIEDKYLYAGDIGNPIFKEKLDAIASNGELTYFMIRKIDDVDFASQERYLGLVKDREFEGYTLPDNVIIIFTVKDREGLKKISKELYKFCVVAF